MMRKKKNDGQAQPMQLGFDFEFTQTVAAIERIRANVETNDEGDDNVDRERAAVGDRNASTESGNAIDPASK